MSQELRDLEKMPRVLIDLELERTDSGVRYLFTANSHLRTTPIINSQGGAFDENDSELTRIGFPSKVGNGSRHLYANGANKISLDNIGLVGVYLNDGGSIGAESDNLQYSDSNGRVVLVNGEAVAKK